ncbi:Nucleoporin autopeptidase family protein [Babesia bovis T2Bo]|uniref:Peptidase S59 domain-containing protein n=1 Tax=Babesia bovis TaxID=5865 RepID=A7APB0_BABBO|nr:Nucleoporin autopeptidase family protein [Babesia bovis T2Bo]EDO08394.1 Nucleoporin autopeptidase family protein [Babesia bovis T2Bo]|eukprot:XP_001611962.1 hypothetical protein [Babesia bovis T2Bo]
MFGNNNRGSSFWSSSPQQNTGIASSLNTLGSLVPSGQNVGSTFGGFGSSNTMVTGGFMNQTTGSTFGASQNTSLFGQSTQQNPSSGFGTVSNTGSFFDQNKQGFMGSSNNIFGQSSTNTTGGGLFGSGLNTGVTSSFGNNMNTGSSLFGSSTQNTGSTWTGGSSTAFGTQIQGNEAATTQTFDNCSITHISFDKPEFCADEFRWEYYKKANPQVGSSLMQQNTGTTTSTGLFGSTQPATTSTGIGLFGSSQPSTTTTTSPFATTQPGTTTTGTGLFGSSQPSNTGGFFGSTPSTTTTTGGLFGSSQTNTTGGLFGSTQPSTTGGLFGTTQSTTTGGLFGSTQPSTTGGLFGTTQPSTSGGLFGTTQPSTTTTSAGLFGSTQPSTPTTSSGLFGSSQSNTTGLLGSTQPASSTTGLFGTNTTSNTGSTGLFGSSTTSTIGTSNTGLFGNYNASNTNTTTGTTGTGLFGSSTNTGSTTTGATNTLFGSTQPSSTGGLFGNTQAAPSTQSNLFSNSSLNTTTGNASTSSLFGTTGTGSSNLFGTNTTTPGSSSSLFSFGSGTNQPLGSSTLFGQTTQTQGSNTSLSRLNINFNIRDSSPGLRSFWTNDAALPQEAKDYLMKITNARKNLTETLAHSSQPKQSESVIDGIEDMNDRFGCRKILRELGVELPRYMLHISSDNTDYDDAKSRQPVVPTPEAKFQEGFSAGFTNVIQKSPDGSLDGHSSDKYSCLDDQFLSLHNGGAKEFEALRHQARGCHLRRPNDPVTLQSDDLPSVSRRKSLFEEHVNQLTSDVDLITQEADQQRSVLGQLDTQCNVSQKSILTEDNAEVLQDDNAVCLDSPLPQEASSASSCPIFKLADDTPGNPPILTREGYSTRPTMASLRQMTDKQLSNVMDFQVTREGFGDILWPGYTDLRGLNLDKIVDIGNRKVTLYGGTSQIHPVGEGLNKQATVTLYNCIPDDSGKDKSITETVKQLEQLKEHTESLGCKFLSGNLKTGKWVFTAPCFVKTGAGDVINRKDLAFMY